MSRLLWLAAVPGWLWFAWRAYEVVWPIDQLLSASFVLACIGSAFRMLYRAMEPQP